MISLLLAALIGPTPAPQPTVPIDFERFCESHHAGAYRGLVLSRQIPHVTILCARVDYLCYKTCENPVPHFNGTP
jgi:hypothetical protein